VGELSGLPASLGARPALSAFAVEFALGGVDAGRLDLLPRRIELVLRRLGTVPTLRDGGILATT